jgi:hypothetical protein
MNVLETVTALIVLLGVTLLAIFGKVSSDDVKSVYTIVLGYVFGAAIGRLKKNDKDSGGGA